MYVFTLVILEKITTVKNLSNIIVDEDTKIVKFDQPLIQNVHFVEYIHE